MREAGGDDPAFYTEGNGRCYRDNKKLEEESGVIRLTCEKDTGSSVWSGPGRRSQGRDDSRQSRDSGRAVWVGKPGTNQTAAS